MSWNVIYDFESAHQQGGEPRLEDFVPADAADRVRLAAELAFVDLEYRRKRRLPIRVTGYLGPFPELAANQELLLSLIVAECEQRRQAGEEPGVEEFARAYPAVAERLVRRLVERTSPTVPTPPAPGPAELPAIPGYEVLSVLGEGGMGTVYRARQPALDRVVALKRIKGGSHVSPTDLQRFRTEAQAVARLQHPNVVQVHEIGECEGLPYFTLEYCGGGSLARKLDGKPLPADESARLVETLARALEAAHQRSIIHRDLKPQNVLLTADGVPKISDFGLAKKLDTPTEQTHSGAILGTPSYMAPEQAQGRAGTAGPATDIYGLGAILYELLTGRPPFVARTAVETVVQVQTEDPLPVRRLQPATPPDLETICLHCLHKEPKARYTSAAALAEDLRRFLAHEPIVARPPTRLQQFRMWARRRPALTGILGTSVLATTILVPLLTAGMIITLTALNDARASEAEAKKQTALARKSMHKGLEAMDTSLNRLSEDVLANIPGTQAVRRDLLDRAVAGYQEMLDIWPEEPDVRAEVGAAWFRLAWLSMDLDREKTTVELTDRAIGYQRELIRTDLENSRYRLDLANMLRVRATRLSRTGNLKSALEANQEACELCEILCRNPDVQRDRKFWVACQEVLGEANADRGWALHTHNRLREARDQYLTTVESLEKALGQVPGDLALTQALARARLETGLILRLSGEMDASADHLKRSERLFEGLPKPVANLTRNQVRLASVYNAQFITLFATNQSDAALPCIRKAIAIRSKLVQDNPLAVPLRADLATALNNLASFEHKRGDFAGCCEHCTQAVRLMDEAVAANQDVVSYRNSLANFSLSLISLLVKLRRLSDIEDAFQIFTRAQSELPSEWYNAGLSLARAAELARDPEVNRTRFAEQAVVALRRAHELGFLDSAKLQKEVPLTALQGAPGFEELKKEYGLSDSQHP